MEHEGWAECLRSCTRRDRVENTPFRRMIKKMPGESAHATSLTAELLWRLSSLDKQTSYQSTYKVCPHHVLPPLPRVHTMSAPPPPCTCTCIYTVCPPYPHTMSVTFPPPMFMQCLSPHACWCRPGADSADQVCADRG